MIKPVHLIDQHLAAGEHVTFTDNHLMLIGIDPDHIERAFGFITILDAADTQPLALADGVIDHAVMAAQRCAVMIDDLTRFDRAGRSRRTTSP